MGITEALRKRANFRRIAGHGAWLFADKALRAAIGLVIGAIVARHLGPASFGALNVVIAYVVLFASVAGLGMDGVVVRDLVKHPDARERILGTAFIIKLVGGLLVFVIGNAIVWMISAESYDLWLLTVVGSSALFFYAADVIDFWFQSRLKGKSIVMARASGFVLTSGLKLTFVFAGAPLILFASTPAIEALLAGCLLCLAYLLSGETPKRWKFEAKRAQELIRTSAPIAISGFFVVAIMQIDKLMLERMAGPQAIGIYSAALLLSTAWYMVPLIIGASVAPTLTSYYESARPAYVRRLQDVFSLVTMTSLGAACVMAVLSHLLVDVIYGETYSRAAWVLTLHVWTSPFVAHVSVRTRALLIEGKMRWILAFSGLTLLTNIILNAFLIDKFAELGAAAASVVSWGLSAWLFPLLSAQTRTFVGMGARSYLPGFWMKAIRR